MFKQLALGAALVCAISSTALAGNGTNLTKFLPETTQAMVVMDVSAAKGSKLLKDSFQKMIDSKPDAQAKMAELGIDPMKDIDTVVFAMGGAQELSKMGDGNLVVIVEGRLPKDKMGQMTKATKTTYKGVEVWTKDDSEGAIIDGRLFFTKKGQLSTTIDLVKGGKASLATGAGGKAMRDALKGTNTKSHMWMSIVVPAKDRDMLKSTAQIQAENVALTFDFAEDVKAGVRIGTISADNAKNAVGMINGVLPQLKGGLGSVGLSAASSTVVVGQDGTAITASIRVSNAEIKSLIAMVSAKAAAAAPAPTPAPAKSGLGAPAKKP